MPVAAHSAGVRSPNELCGRSGLDSSFQTAPNAWAWGSFSNSSRSRNASGGLPRNDSAEPFCHGLAGATSSAVEPPLPGAIAPVPKILRDFWPFLCSNPAEFDSQMMLECKSV